MENRLKPGRRVIVALRKMIASGELKSGERIAEIPTAEALGVSRMPVRTALRALEQEGLVVKLGARGYAARGLSVPEIEGAVLVRGALEGLAARQVTELGDPRVQAALERCLADGEALFAKGRLEPGDLERYYDYNLAFHDILVEASGNPAIAAALARNNYLPFASAAALALDWDDLAAEFDHLYAAHGQHQAVVAAIRAGDVDEADRVMRDHALAAIRNVKVFARLGSAGQAAHAAWAIRSD